MEANAYQTPQADLTTESDSEVAYYIVSTQKFLTLFIATLGIYGVYWFYKNWSLHKASTNSNVWPVMRGIFSIFFTHSLFRHVNDTLKSKNITYEWNYEFIATIYVASAVLSNISDRLSAKEIGSPITDFIGFLFLGTMAWALYKAQITINASCDDPEGLSNNSFSAANIAWIVLGVALWGLILVGMTSYM